MVESALPSFISQDPQRNVIKYFTLNKNDTGIYDIVIYAKLTDYGGTY